MYQIMNRYQIIQLADIPAYNFEGYYWYSDADKPEPLTNGKIDTAWFTALPFVVEANFYAAAEHCSIQIKNIDGQYHVARIDLFDLDPELHLRRTYKGHDIEGRDFVLIEAWEEKQDDTLQLLTGMKTLQPVWDAFAGFVNR